MGHAARGGGATDGDATTAAYAAARGGGKATDGPAQDPHPRWRPDPPVEPKGPPRARDTCGKMAAGSGP